MAIFGILTVIFIADAPDRQVFHWFNQLSAYSGTQIWSYITMFGDTLVTSLLLVLVFRKKPHLVASVLVAAIPVVLVVHTLKPVLNLPRPPKVLTEELITVIGPCHTSKSFPSGHTATIFTFVSVFYFYARSFPARMTFLLIGILVGCSRMVVGVHWPVDVAAGALLGWIGGYIGYVSTPALRWATCQKARIVYAILLLVSSVILATSHKIRYKETILFFRTFGWLCAIWCCWQIILVVKNRQKLKSLTSPNE